jgi:DNA-binding protein H-NS
MPEPQPTSAADVKALCEERDIRFIRFWFTDILGILKSVAITVEELEHALSDGVSFDGASGSAKLLSKQIGDASKLEENLKLINDMQRGCVTAKSAKAQIPRNAPEEYTKDDAAKAKFADTARAELKAKIDALIVGSDFTISDLHPMAGRGRKRSKSFAKYANPEDRSQTWTGRGRKPNWLVARLKKGAKMEDFAI